MSDFRTILSELRRPRLLMRAARFGMEEYRRDRDLRRLLNGNMQPERAVPRLICEEALMEDTRRRGDATYSVSRHIEVLIALMAEARLLPRVPQS